MAAFSITLDDDVQNTLFDLCVSHFDRNENITSDLVFRHVIAAFLTNLEKCHIDQTLKYFFSLIIVTPKASQLINFERKLEPGERAFYAAVQIREKATNGEKTHYVYTYIRDQRPKVVVVNGKHMYVDPRTGKHATVVASYDRKTMHCFMEMTEQDKREHAFFKKWLEALNKENEGDNHAGDQDKPQ